MGAPGPAPRQAPGYTAAPLASSALGSCCTPSPNPEAGPHARSVERSRSNVKRAKTERSARAPEPGLTPDRTLARPRKGLGAGATQSGRASLLSRAGPRCLGAGPRCACRPPSLARRSWNPSPLRFPLYQQQRKCCPCAHDTGLSQILWIKCTRRPPECDAEDRFSRPWACLRYPTQGPTLRRC